MENFTKQFEHLHLDKQKLPPVSLTGWQFLTRMLLQIVELLLVHSTFHYSHNNTLNSYPFTIDTNYILLPNNCASTLLCFTTSNGFVLRFCWLLQLHRFS